MPTSCDDVLLDINYSAQAVGGPEFATAIVRSGSGGAIAHRNENLEDYISKYDIEFGEMDQSKFDNLRTFAINRRGMARAFLFLAPDHSHLTRETVGRLNALTGEVEYLAGTDGTETVFYAIKNYSDPFVAYNRRICKLSPYELLKVEVFNASDLNVLVAASNLVPDNYTGLYYDPVVATKNGLLGGDNFATRSVAVYYRTGKISITPALPAGMVVRITGEYLLPVTFTEDWFRFDIDVVTTGGFKIQVAEVLPVELGIV